MNPDLLTVEELAIELKVKTSWVYRNAKKLGAYHVGKYLRFSWDRVVEYIERNSNPLGPKPNDPKYHA